MKNFFKAVLIGIIWGLLGVKNVSASVLSTDYIDNVYAYHYKDGILRSYGKLPFRYQDGNLAYCIEPNRVINTYEYSSTTDWSVSGYSEDDKRRMELIAHYGYSYPGHNTVRYYMATQELIWLFSDDYVKWVDTYSTDGNSGNVLNVDAEKNEILRLISNHDILPNFGNTYFYRYLGDVFTLTDRNGVLDNYDIESTINYRYTNSSSIEFTVNKMGDQKVKFKSKSINNTITTVYFVPGVDTQTMVTFGFSDSKELSIDIKGCTARVKINKLDKNSGELITARAEFEVRNIISIVSSPYYTVNGSATFNLFKGKYVITEVKAPDGYLINKDQIEIDINDNIPLENGYYIVNVYDEKPTGKITVNKTDEEGSKLDDVKIGLYNENHELINTINTTDNNSFDNLPIGKYYIKELETVYGYLLDDKEYEINISYLNQDTSIINQSLDIINQKIKCNIVYISKENIDDIQFDVYDDKNNKVYSSKTKNGQAIIENIPYGKYYIKQIKVPSGYILNEDTYTFYVNDSTCQSKITTHNEKTIMPVTSTSFNLSMCIVLTLYLVGIYNYVKKNN